MKKILPKKALLVSVLSVILCMTMLIGSTFAWFTDTANIAVNTIQSGDLDVGILDMNSDSLEGKILKWQVANQQDDILWEPGCTYNLEPFQVVNKGNLALRFRIAVSGIEGNPALLDVLEFKITREGNTSEIAGIELSDFLDAYECSLLPEGATPKTEKELVHTSGAITISVHMKETAGNMYQKEKIDGIAIVVTASQYTYEMDGKDNQYDQGAHAHSYRTTVTPPTCTEKGYTTYQCNFCDDGEVKDYVDPLGHNLVNGTCSRCGYMVYQEEGEYVYFGSYPQSKVTDDALIATLNMQIKNADNDVTYNGNKYRALNGAWFKYEPIKWRVAYRNAETGEAYLLADQMLAVMQYRSDYDWNKRGTPQTIDGEQVYYPNYKHSDIRKWLTGTFYDTAFSADQKQMVFVKTTKAEGGYTGSDTEDAVFLPSFSELNGIYGSNYSQKHFNNYSAKSLTAYAYSVNNKTPSRWWTRSGNGSAGTGSSTNYITMTVENSGGNWFQYSSGAGAFFGVVPAMWVVLK